MRTLNTQELTAVSGAGANVDYYADISAVGSTIYVGSFIGSLASGMMKELGVICASQLGAGSFGTAATSAINMLGPMSYFAAPLFVGAQIVSANPWMSDAMVDKYHAYFG